MAVGELLERTTLVLHLRRGRNRAKTAAVSEVCALLSGFDAEVASGGPLSEVAGIAWVTVPTHVHRAAAKFVQGLGYTQAIDVVVSLEDAPENAPIVRWRKREHALVRIYEESDEDLRADAPDRRSFLLECGDGVVRRINGYRGGRGPLEHRALAVPDARLLVNLLGPPAGVMLDPFAGAGGIVVEAVRRSWRTVSADIDGALRFGLAEISDYHLVADARALPLASESIGGIAMEPPYDHAVTELVAESIIECERVIVRGGSIVVLAAAEQTTALKASGHSAGLWLDLEAPINRKGSDVVCLRWKKRL